MSERDEQTELLRLIWNEMKLLGANLGGRIDSVRAELDALRVELKAEVAGVRESVERTNSRLDHFIKFAGGRDKGLRRRASRDPSPDARPRAPTAADRS